MSPNTASLAPPDTVPAPAERRKTPRHLGRATVVVFRDSDAMRSGMPVELENISATGIGIVSSATFNHDEQVKVRVQNVVQRFVKDLRGIVRWQQPLPGGKVRTGVELISRLTAIDLMSLKRAGLGDTSTNGRRWV